jgi:hypothetical protein
VLCGLLKVRVIHESEELSALTSVVELEIGGQRLVAVPMGKGVWQFTTPVGQCDLDLSFVIKYEYTDKSTEATSHIRVPVTEACQTHLLAHK